ncbi:hypothetical protein LCGC14_1366260 [marine sediment metagenome]|uniref:Uncharacterized protein n=1 Tax=marine sediment metagenome TaxID=412755 RepID=A0A0F9N8S2_9ZZZZ
MALPHLNKDIFVINGHGDQITINRNLIEWKTSGKSKLSCVWCEFEEKQNYMTRNDLLDLEE